MPIVHEVSNIGDIYMARFGTHTTTILVPQLPANDKYATEKRNGAQNNDNKNIYIMVGLIVSLQEY